MSLDQQDRSDAIDRYLLRRIARADEEAFAMLYRKYSKVVYSSAMEILNHREEADEAVQDAFLRIWNKAHLYDPDKSRAFSWIYTVTRRVFICRKAQLLGSRVDVSILHDNVLPEVETPTRQRETSEHLQHYLNQLPENQRICIRMALIKGFTSEEIARITGKPVGSVKTWIRRGLLILRRKFKS